MPKEFKTKEGKFDGGAAYRYGRRKEYEIVKAARDLGALAFRSAGSHSIVDIVAIFHKEKRIELIQCKRGKSISESAKAKIVRDNRLLNGTFEVEFKVI